MFKVVLDTNVLVATVRSRRGASYRLLELLGDERFSLAISVAAILEYEEVLCREITPGGWNRENVDAILDMMCHLGERHDIPFRIRPSSPDPDDEMLIELAFAASVDYIVTHNTRDFAGSEPFGIRAINPGRFLSLLEGRP
jgi:putative PIN family toxin of toxin-antitoxin system